MGQIHAVILLCPGFLSGLSSGSNSCGHASASWALVRIVFLGQIYAVTILCPGFLSGLSSGSTSCGYTAASWVPVCVVLWVNFMRKPLTLN